MLRRVRLATLQTRTWALFREGMRLIHYEISPHQRTSIAGDDTLLRYLPVHFSEGEAARLPGKPVDDYLKTFNGKSGFCEPVA